MSYQTDSESIHQIINTHEKVIDNEITSLFKEIYERIFKQQQKYYTPIISKLERKLEEQKLNNSTMEKRSGNIGNEMEKLNLLFERFVEHLAIIRNRDRISNDRSKIFHAWRDLSLSRSVIENSMYSIFLKEPIKRILFKRWIRKMRKARLIRQRRELRRNCDRDIRNLETETSQRITSLQSELVAVKELLIEYEQQHSEMQQKLRRAFMRGVVNLNLEAIDVFGEMPSTEAINNHLKNKPSPKKNSKNLNSDEEIDEFFVEPAPRISVIRHK